MIEVEAKARLLHPEKLRVVIQKIARYKGKERKLDDYYTLEDIKKYPMKSLRIRKKGAIHQVNFKRRIGKQGLIDAKNECEFELHELPKFLELLEEFGFEKWLTKEKYTEVYEIKKNFHIELNHLKNLGWFIEVEYLCNKKDIEKAKKEVEKVIEKLNIDKKEIEHKGYTRLLWEKKK